jgi:hypothetical protein
MSPSAAACAAANSLSWASTSWHPVDATCSTSLSIAFSRAGERSIERM